MKKQELINKVTSMGRLDTKTYRYLLAGNKIKRIKRIYLDTTTALSDMDSYNPNGLEKIEEL